MAESEIKITSKPKFPYRIKFEPRLEQLSGWMMPVISLIAVVAALFLGAIILEIAGGNAWAAYAHIFRASFGSLGVLSDTLVKATPLIFVGLACAIAFRMKLWNIGAEGQFYMGAFGASAVVLIPVLPETTPKWMWLVTMALAGMFCGALWGAIPGFLKAQYKVNEVISTLIDDCEKNIEEMNTETDRDYIENNLETIKELEKVKTTQDLLEIFDEEYILSRFGIESLEYIDDER